MSTPANSPKLPDQVQAVLRTKHYSIRTERWPAADGVCAATIFARYKRATGTKDVQTIMIYTHVLNRGGKGVQSPLDNL